MFQYKIIHNILPTKVSLFKAKICDDDICPQCFADRHSLDHMFLHCQLPLYFWDLLGDSRKYPYPTMGGMTILNPRALGNSKMLIPPALPSEFQNR